jgi:DNA-binding response OmpR family regulator
MMKLLLVEDDPILGKSLKNTLELEGFFVAWAQNIKSAKEAAGNDDFQCFIFDIGLPDGDGISLCAHMRNQFQSLPILFLTAQTDEETLVKAFEAGGNDFLRKPFSQKELLVRIKALTRNLKGTKSRSVYKELKVDIEARSVTYGTQKIDLNLTQIQILYFLVQNAENVITRDRLIEFLGKENEIFDRTIDSHISHIRKILKQEKVLDIQIKSVYGVGYKLEVEEQS